MCILCLDENNPTKLISQKNNIDLNLKTISVACCVGFFSGRVRALMRDPIKLPRVKGCNY